MKMAFSELYHLYILGSFSWLVVEWEISHHTKDVKNLPASHTSILDGEKNLRPWIFLAKNCVVSGGMTQKQLWFKFELYVFIKKSLYCPE